MGFGGISIWQLLIVLGIVVLLFGTKKLRNIGGDLGNAVKGFKKAMKDEDAEQAQKKITSDDAAFSADDVKDASKAEKQADKADK